GAQRAPAFERLNPFRQVPVLLLDDGTALSETMAICRYFEETNPEPALFGRGPLERAVVEMWNRRVEFCLFAGVTQAFRHLHPAMARFEVPQVPAWGEANKAKAVAALDILEEVLGRSPFVAGEHYSVADITALVAIDFMRPARIERPQNHPNLARWYERMAARPSAKA